MIFITLGSQKFQFNRLLIAVDKVIDRNEIKDEVFAQIGYSDYKPRNYEYKKFLDHETFAEMEDRADIVLTHGGTGAIMGAVKKRKKVIAVPRLAQYGEHVDDHQLQVLREFENLGIILVCYDTDYLGKVFERIYSEEMRPYISNKRNIIESIDNFLKEIVH